MKNYDNAIKFFCSIMIIICLILLFFQYENSYLEPYMKDICDTRGKQEVIRVITDVVEDVMLKKSDSYNSLIRISTDDKNTVKSIQMNTAEVNAIENEVVRQINSEFSKIENTDYKFSVGSMTGIYALAGRSLKVKVKILPLSNVNAHIESSFDSAGINQTIHRVTLKITADTTFLTPSYRENTNVELEYILAETVIVGDLPRGILDVE